MGKASIITGDEKIHITAKCKNDGRIVLSTTSSTTSSPTLLKVRVGIQADPKEKEFHLELGCYATNGFSLTEDMADLVKKDREITLLCKVDKTEVTPESALLKNWELNVEKFDPAK